MIKLATILDKNRKGDPYEEVRVSYGGSVNPKIECTNSPLTTRHKKHVTQFIPEEYGFRVPIQQNV